MGNIHYLSTPSDAQARLLEQLITRTIANHPDAAVAKRWSELARGTATKYPGPPPPTQKQIDLDSIKGLSDDDRQQVLDSVQGFLESYFNDVRDQLMAMHAELLRCQKTIAEFETVQAVKDQFKENRKGKNDD